MLCEQLVSQGGTQEFTPKKTISAPGIAHVGGMNSSGNWGYRQFVLSGMQRFARREAPMLNVKTAHRLRLCIDCRDAFLGYHGAPPRHICKVARHVQRNRPSAGERLSSMSGAGSQIAQRSGTTRTSSASASDARRVAASSSLCGPSAARASRRAPSTAPIASTSVGVIRCSHLPRRRMSSMPLRRKAARTVRA